MICPTCHGCGDCAVARDAGLEHCVTHAVEPVRLRVIEAAARAYRDAERHRPAGPPAAVGRHMLREIECRRALDDALGRPA